MATAFHENMNDDSLIQFRYFSELPTELILVLATVIDFPGVLRLEGVDRCLNNLIRSYKDSISKDTIVFQFPHFLALQFCDVPRPSTMLSFASMVSYHVERTVKGVPGYSRDKEVLRTGLFLAMKVSLPRDKFGPGRNEMRVAYLAGMPAMCLLYIHRATTIIAQMFMDRYQDILFTAPIVRAPGGFEFDLVRIAVRLNCLTMGFRWAWETMESHDCQPEDDTGRHLRYLIFCLSRSFFGRTHLGAINRTFTGRMKACLGGYDTEFELDHDILCMTRLGVGRSVQLLKEAGAALADVEHEVRERRKAKAKVG
jgi:hypothetical protein